VKLEKVALTAEMGCDFALCSVATTRCHSASWSLHGLLLGLPWIDMVSLYRHRKRMYRGGSRLKSRFLQTAGSG
jgi:hypothetical protein